MAPYESATFIGQAFGWSGVDLLQETDRDFRRYALEALEALLDRIRPVRPMRFTTRLPFAPLARRVIRNWHGTLG